VPKPILAWPGSSVLLSLLFSLAQIAVSFTSIWNYFAHEELQIEQNKINQLDVVIKINLGFLHI